MWGTDLTTTFTGEGPAAVFVAVDHCSAECVGVHAHSRVSRFEVLEPIRQGVRRHFGGLPRASPLVFRCGMTTDHNTCRTTSRRRSASSASKVRPPSSARPRVTAVLNGSSGRSRKTCCGYATSRRLRNCARLCWRSARSTTRRGSLNGTASSARRRSVRSNFNPLPGRHRVQPGVPETAGGTVRPYPPRRSLPSQERLLSCHCAPVLECNLNIGWVQLDPTKETTGALGSDKRGSRAEE